MENKQQQKMWAVHPILSYRANKSLMIMINDFDCPVAQSMLEQRTLAVVAFFAIRQRQINDSLGKITSSRFCLPKLSLKEKGVKVGVLIRTLNIIRFSIEKCYLNLLLKLQSKYFC